jgi:hypothetical protein
MRIYLNRKPVDGAWGGGNKSVSLLASTLRERGHDIIFDLVPGKIDLIFCFDPRPNEKGIWYQNFLDYKSVQNVPVLQRVGDVGTHSKPDLTKLVIQSTQLSDFVFFPSLWAKDHIGYSNENFKIVRNFPMAKFYLKRCTKKINFPLSISTHHWSTNSKKGFETYRFLDGYCQNSSHSFTYAGRKPDDISFKNWIPPLYDEQIVDFLTCHNVYLTASEEEAGANHVQEAMAAGLPVIYKSGGGSIDEYVGDAGICFKSTSDLINILESQSTLGALNEAKKNALKQVQTLEDSILEYVQIIEGFGT